MCPPKNKPKTNKQTKNVEQRRYQFRQGYLLRVGNAQDGRGKYVQDNKEENRQLLW